MDMSANDKDGKKKGKKQEGLETSRKYCVLKGLLVSRFVMVNFKSLIVLQHFFFFFQATIILFISSLWKFTNTLLESKPEQ